MICKDCNKIALEFITGAGEIKYVCFCKKNIKIEKIDKIKITRGIIDKQVNKINKEIADTEENKIKKINELKNTKTRSKIDEKRDEIANLNVILDILNDQREALKK
jgi:hypothetical protein